MAATVFSNDMVAHVWAQQRQIEGRSNNGQFYFHGPALYSYGSHFVAGIIDKAGRVWLTNRSYSNTTAKHMSHARRAVKYDYLSLPELDSLQYTLRDLGGKLAPGDVATIKQYLAKHWAALPADHKGAEILQAAISRRPWAKEYGERKAKADRLAEKNRKLARKYELARAAEVAAIPLDMIRLRMIQTATGSNDYNKESNLKAAVRVYRDAHRDSAPGKVRKALWERVKLATELANRLGQFTGKRFAKERGAIATLRRIWARDYGSEGVDLAGQRNYALAEVQALDKLNALHMPAAMRQRGIERRAELSTGIERLDAEIAAARYEAERERCEAWRRGESVSGRYGLACENGGALLRAIDADIDGCEIKDGTLETSQGATVPLRHAFAVFAFVRRCRAQGLPWLPRETGGIPNRAYQMSHAIHGPRHIRVGHFTVDSIDASGNFEAGCHSIKWPEVERLARSLGVFDCAEVEIADAP